jgi:predicted NBD/HSP70 family sugar kinase
MLSTDEGLDTQASVRRANLRRALQLVFRNPGTQTRAGIARSTGLTAATASSLVAELIESRLIVEGEQAASTGGKRATTLSVDSSHHLILTLVIRPTDVRMALVALDGTEVDANWGAYSAETREVVLMGMLQAIADEYGDRLLVVGVQLPGTTDGRHVLESVQLGWRDIPLAAQFEQVLDVPVLLVNDVDAEALAEVVMTDGLAGYRLFVHIGVGIGAALTLGDELTPGPRSRAGEIGHVQVVFGDDARPCRCGRRGCLESASSMTAMLGDELSDAMDDDAIVSIAERADERLLAGGAQALARAIKLIAAVLDTAEVVIGGPVCALGEPFLHRVRREIDYVAIGTVTVPVRYAKARGRSDIGVAQFALSSALGVRWAPEQLRAALIV